MITLKIMKIQENTKKKTPMTYISEKDTCSKYIRDSYEKIRNKCLIIKWPKRHFMNGS